MKYLSSAVILAIIAVSSAQFPFWKSRVNPVICYNFYGECLTKYSERAASESLSCEHTRNSSATDAFSIFNKTMSHIQEQIKVIQEKIDCGSLKTEAEQQNCFNNLARNNINGLKEIENDSLNAYRRRNQSIEIAEAICDRCESEVNIEMSSAILEIDNILNSCYINGQYVTPTHKWYLDDLPTPSTQAPEPTTITSKPDPVTNPSSPSTNFHE